MRKLYIDLAIAVISVYMILKHTLFFLSLIIAAAVVWFFVLDEKKKHQITEKIREFYR